jgi:hypothetical protein
MLLLFHLNKNERMLFLLESIIKNMGDSCRKGKKCIYICVSKSTR